MSIRPLPEIPDFQISADMGWDMRPDAVDRWQAGVKAADAPENSISIYETIGHDYWTGEGMTSNRVAGMLRKIGDADIVVNINSPGGDFFEGVSIYNLLRQHKASVTVRVMGVAASAASVIAMAGDRIEIGAASFLMIHNAWAGAVGNRHDFRKAADMLEPFDAAMAQVYAARTGMDVLAAAKLMDGETWISGASALDMGFADALLDGDKIVEDAQASVAASSVKALRRVDSLLAKQNISRSERRELFANIKRNTHDAVPTATQDAGHSDFLASIQSTIRTIAQN
ncbi:head maturation protease, ClpP-related [Kaistia terrae]|uniref:ATP-dependent Clp protease proteolytic subunit n=1 Tax=Kaistia terrae TaxID=537017 RepID=A0ABW0Q4Y1_9HYPH|nr:head maturation protease, ClpP-related [Kaistia terrae]MCX5581332.1 Clp protease ClpP [Kaistia terrae]